MVSYVIFLVLLTTEIGTINKGSKTDRLSEVIDITIWIYIASIIFRNVKTIYNIVSESRVKFNTRYQSFHAATRAISKDWWLMYDMMMNMIFVLSFVAAVVSVYNVHNDYHYIYMPRTCWSWNDPALLSEGFFAIAVVFAFGKVLYFFKAFSLLGPIQVSLSKMVFDVREMFIIIVITIVAFSIGLYSLFHYYDDLKHGNDVADAINQSKTFST